jgi:hypothetical protein
VRGEEGAWATPAKRWLAGEEGKMAGPMIQCGFDLN